MSVKATRRLLDHYQRLWSGAIGRVRAGDVERDPILASHSPDPRRGLTVVARPSPVVRRRVAALVRQVRGLEPEQHYYAPGELHVTVLSLFTATVDHEPLLARTARYVTAVDSALRRVPPFRIEFAGLTVSPGAILVRGFPADDTLDRLREALRHALRDRALEEGVDARYRLQTAHMTVARFRAPLRDGPRLAAALERARRRPFGTTGVRSVSLVRGDWYMSRGFTETVKRYRLSPAAGWRDGLRPI